MNTQGGIKMKAILISIHPQWVGLILNFIKKDEIRKGTAIGKAINKLIKEQGVAPMLIYCTKDTKNIYRIMRNYDNKVLKLVASSKTIQEELKDKNTINGKVVARFNATAEEIICRPICGEWECYTKTQGYSEIAEASCLENKEIVHYLKGKNGTAIHIHDLEIFDESKEISEFKSYKKNIVDTKINGIVFETELDNSLTKAPQSWCYVEVEDEE